MDEEATAAAEGQAGQEEGGDGGVDGLFQLEEEPETLLAPPTAYGAIEDHMGGGGGEGVAFGSHQRDLEELAGLLLSSDDEGEGEGEGEGETAAMMDVDGGNNGGMSQEF